MANAAATSDQPGVVVHLLRGRASRQAQPMLGANLLVGADAQCDIQMRSPEVAPKHCLLTRRDGRLLATRLEAQHPVLRNGVALIEEELADGDELTIGPFALRVSFSAAAVAPRPAAPGPLPLPARPSFPLLRRKSEAEAAAQAAPPDHAARDGLQELEARAAELRAWEARLGADGAELDRRHAALGDAQAQLQAETAAVQARGERLDALRRKETERARRRRGRLAGLLADLESRRDAAAAAPDPAALEFARLHAEHQANAADLERRAAELAGQTARLATEQELLAREWRRVEQARAEHEALRADVERRAAELARDEASLREVRAETTRDRQRLVVEMEHLERRTEAVSADETRLRDRDAALAGEALRLRGEARSLRTEIERERAALERERAAVAAEAAAQEEAQLIFAGEREAWRGRQEALEVERGELARHATLLAAREREWSGAGFHQERAALVAEQALLTRRAQDAAARAAAAEAESRRLAAVARDLEARQAALLERERRLAEDTARRGADFQDREAALAAARQELAATAGRETPRPRRLGWRLPPRAVDTARHAAFAGRLAECEAELRELRASHGHLAATLRDYQNWIAERERAASAWLLALRTESHALRAAQGRLAERGGDRPWQAAVGDWSARLERLHRTLSEGEAALGLPAGSVGGDEDFPELPAATPLAAAEAPRDVIPFVRPPAPAPIPAAQPRAAAAAVVALPADFGSAPLPAETDRQWLFGLAEAGVADDAVLQWMLDHTRRNRLPLVETLVAEGIATAYQVELARQGRHAELALGPFRVLDRLHEGKVASTFRVMAPEHQRPLAFRWCRAGLIANPARQSDYQAHVRALAGFRHPAFATPLACQVIDSRPGVLTEILRGEPLAAAGRKLAPGDQAAAFRQVAGALAALQENGFAHRSLRPSRVLLDRHGRVGILGLGEPTWLARLHACELGAAADYYVAPEQLDPDRPVDARADLCAAGRIFLELALGRRPREGEAVRLPAGYPAGYTALLARCVEPDPAQRPGSLASVAAELDRLLVVAPAPHRAAA